LGEPLAVSIPSMGGGQDIAFSLLGWGRGTVLWLSLF
jgi:hypothetical protein